VKVPTVRHAQIQPWDVPTARKAMAYARRQRIYALLVLLLMVCGWALNPYLTPTSRPKWLYSTILIGSLFAWPIVAVSLAARLVYTGIAGDRPSNWPAVAIRLAVAALLLLVVGNLIVTETVWVQAEDSLSVIPVLVFTTGVAAAMLMAWEARGWRKLGALILALVVLFTASYAPGLGWRTSPTGLTEARAERIDRAIHRYYERQGRYPSKLADLRPFYLWRIPQPVIFRDQTWCYEGGDDYYRLGYVHQPAFGVPPEHISIRIHAARGEPPKPSWPCDEALEKARSQSPYP